MLAESLGFSSEHQPVGAETAMRLGLPPNIADVAIIRGHGAMRALLFATTDDQPLGSCIARIATALAASTAHVLWLVIGASGTGNDVGVACWPASQRPPRVAALMAHRRRVVASDAEALCLLAANREGDDLLVHTRWCELLGREALSRRFYRVL
ncbi:hypothetical protein BH11GEM2_BH11GEM2_40790 [soil metagenome]